MEVVLNGIDGANPLGFLAALGTIRCLDLADRDLGVKMFWKPTDAWHPVLQTPQDLSEADLLGILVNFLPRSRPFSLADPDGIEAKNISVSLETFRWAAQQAVARSDAKRRAQADFLAALASDGVTSEEGAVADTCLRTMSGSGHQHFLEFMDNLIRDTEPHHIEKALFSRWPYDDPVENHTMRWDPSDDLRYALRGRNPSGDPARKQQGAMWGANRLAIEALPLMPSAPARHFLKTTGFRGRNSRDTFWTWPIWDRPVSADVIRSLLGLATLQQDEVDRMSLRRMGIVEIYRCQRITVGKFRNFTQGIPV